MSGGSASVVVLGERLLGWAREREALDRLLGGVLEEGRGGVLVLYGGAGGGKWGGRLCWSTRWWLRGSFGWLGRLGWSRRWSCRSRRFSSCVRRCSGFGRG